VRPGVQADRDAGLPRRGSEFVERAEAGLWRRKPAGQALSIGLAHLDLFSVVGGMSAAVPTDSEGRFKKLLDDPDGTNAKLKLLWLGCGRQDSLFPRSQALADTLSSHKIRHTWMPTEGRHNYTVWRKYLIEVAPLLFRDK